MKHLDKALIASGLMLVLSGGIAAAALGPGAASAVMTAFAPQGGAVIMSDPLGNVDALVQRGPGAPGLHAAAAAYIGISEDALRTELGAGKTLAEVAVAHGKTRDGLIAALTAAAAKDIATLVDQKATGGGPGGPGRVELRIGGDPLAVVGGYLGIPQADLRTKLQGGQTLAAIANATPGKNRDGLIKAIVDDATAKIDQAQKDGKITADQATREKANLTDHTTRLVDSTAPMRGPRR